MQVSHARRNCIRMATIINDGASWRRWLSQFFGATMGEERGKQAAAKATSKSSVNGVGRKGKFNGRLMKRNGRGSRGRRRQKSKLCACARAVWGASMQMGRYDWLQLGRGSRAPGSCHLAAGHPACRMSRCGLSSPSRGIARWRRRSPIDSIVSSGVALPDSCRNSATAFWLLASW